MNKKSIFLIIIILMSFSFSNATHLSNITVSPEAINTTGYITYSVTIYNTSGDPIKEIKFENTTGDSNRQFYYQSVTAPNWNFTIASNHLSATGTPNSAGYRIEVGETLNITVNAKIQNLTASGQTTIMRIVTKDTANSTDAKQFTIIYDNQRPSAPALSSPANGAVINNVRPTLKWNASSDSGSGIRSYTLQVSPNDSFIGAGTITKANLTNTSYTITASEQLNEDTYYWRVYAVDNAGNISPSSTIRSFTVSPVPDLISPANNSVTNDSTPLFQWSSVPYASSYTLQIAENTSFDAPILQKTITSTQYELELSESLSNGVYYWRVKTDLSTGYSGYYKLEVNQNIPNLISPPNNAEITESKPTFEFTKVEGATSYTLQISTSSSFPPASTFTITSGFNTGGTTVTYTMTSDLEDGTYYWRVCADDNPYSNYFKFTIGAVAPEPPVLLSPADNSAIKDTTPTFSWQIVTDASTYILQYKKTSQTWDNAEQRILIGNTSTSYTVGSPLEESEYEWRVKCVNSKDIESQWSDVWSFIIDKTPPQIPPIGPGWSPQNGSIVEDNTPKFEWPAATDSGSGVEKYIFQYATNNDFTDATTITDLYVTYYTPTVSLENDTYFWRVRAVDKAGNVSDFSDSLIVIINVPGQNTVTVIVKSTTGDPIAGATVTLGTNTITTNSEGKAVFENIPNGTYALSVIKEDYTSYSDTYDITGNTTIPVTLASTKKNTVTVYVKDGDNNPVEGAKVTITPTSGPGMTDTTDSDGKAVFTDVESGSYTLKVEKSGFSTYTSSISVTGNKTFNVVLKSKYNLTFTVIDAVENTPIDGAKIKVESLEKTTDTQGKATFTLQSGTYNVRVEKDNYDDGTGAGYTETITVGADTEITVKLYKKGHDLIIGTIHFDDGTVPYQVVAYQDGKTSPYQTATPDTDGNFLMEVEIGHTYEVGVVGYEDQKVKVVLSQKIDKPKTNPITINRAGSIFGVVSDELGKVVVGATVKLYKQDGTLVTTVVSSNKGFVIENVAPGSYYIEVEMEGYEKFKSSIFNVEPRERYNIETLEIKSQKGILKVTVQDKDGNKLNASVKIKSNGEIVEEKTAENGEAEFQLNSGKYTIEVSLEGYKTETVDVDIFGGKTVTKSIILASGTIVTTPPPVKTGSLKIVVKDEKGNPVPEVNVFVDNEMKGKTDEEGTILVENIEEGGHTIRLTKAGFVDKSFTKDVVGDQTIEETATISKEKQPSSNKLKYAAIAVVVILVILFFTYRTKKITPRIPKRKTPFEEEKRESKPPKPGGLPRKPKI